MSLAAYWACRAYYRVVGLHRLLCRFGLGCLCRIGILRCVRLFSAVFTVLLSGFFLGFDAFFCVFFFMSSSLIIVT